MTVRQGTVDAVQNPPSLIQFLLYEERFPYQYSGLAGRLAKGDTSIVKLIKHCRQTGVRQNINRQLAKPLHCRVSCYSQVREYARSPNSIAVCLASVNIDHLVQQRMSVWHV